MKSFRLIFITVLLIQVSCSETQIKKNSLTEHNIKGNVKTIATYYGDEKFGNFEKGDLYEKIFYNDKGNIVEDRIYGDILNGKGLVIINKQIIEYDELGNSTNKLYVLNGDLSDVTKSIYDQDGNQIESTIFNSFIFNSKGIKYRKHIYQYDKYGRKVGESMYDKDNKLGYKYTLSYEDNGKKVVTEMEIFKNGYDMFNYKMDSKYKEISKYDDNGNEFERNEFDKNNKIIESISYQYEDFDETGNWQKKNYHI